MNSNNPRESENQIDDILEVVEILESIEVSDDVIQTNGLGYNSSDGSFLAF